MNKPMSPDVPTRRHVSPTGQDRTGHNRTPTSDVASTTDVDDFTFIELTFSLAEIRALLCYRDVCHPHILDRITADRKLRRALEAA